MGDALLPRNECTEVKLKPCPFCGGEAFFYDYATILCADCYAKIRRAGSIEDSSKRAAAAWNQRVSDPPEEATDD